MQAMIKIKAKNISLLLACTADLWIHACDFRARGRRIAWEWSCKAWIILQNEMDR